MSKKIDGRLARPHGCPSWRHAAARGVALLVLCVLASADAVALPWARAIGTSLTDYPNGFAVAPDGSILVAATLPAQRCVALKLNGDGTLAWAEALSDGLSGTTASLPGLVVPRPTGGWILSTYTDTQGVLIALDADGTVAWSNAYGDVTQYYGITGLVPSGDGGYFVMAEHGDVDPAPWLFKIDATGAMQWQVTQQIAGWGITSAQMIATRDGGLVVAAITAEDLFSGLRDGLVFKLNGLGALQWSRRLTGSGDTEPSTILELADGSLVVGGYDGDSAWLGKLHADGTDDWHELGPATEYGIVSSLAAAPDGRIFATYSRSVPVGNAVVDLLELDATGAILWKRTVPSAEATADVDVVTDGLVLVAGTPAGAGRYDVLVAKTTFLGDPDADCASSPASSAFSPYTMTNVDAGMTPLFPLQPYGPQLITPRVITPFVASPCACAADVAEPDDSCARNVPLLLPGETRALDFCDDASDWIRIEACAGESYTFATTSFVPGVDTFLEVVADDCSTTLAFDDNGGGGLDSRIDWVAPASGSYYLHVTDRMAPGLGSPYTVSITASACSARTWARSFGVAADSEMVNDLEPLPGGGFLAAGEARSSNGLSAWLVEFDAAGAIARQEAFWFGVPASALRVGRLRSGDLIVVGKLTNADSSTDGFVMRLDAAWDVTWSRVMGDALHQQCRDFIERDDGTIVVTVAQQTSTDLVDLDPATGSVLRDVAMGDRVDTLAPAADGGWLAVGNTTRWAAGFSDAWCVRFDATGAVTWQVHLGGPGFDGWSAAAEMPDGSWALGGYTSDAAGDRFPTVTRLDAAGNVTWDNRYDTRVSTSDSVEAILARPDGTLVVVWLRPMSPPADGERLLALDGTGAPLWTRFHEVPQLLNWAEDLIARPGGGMILLSQWDERPVIWPDGWLVAVDDMGVVDPGCAAFQDEPSVRDPLTRSGGPTTALPAASTIPVSDGTVTFESTLALLRSECAELASSVAPPSEVSPPGSPQPLVFTSRTDLAWEDASLSRSDTFDLYRGDVADLHAGSRGSCLQSAIATPAATDSALPVPGRAFFYIVTGKNAGGEGTMGHDSFGTERVNGSPCP